MSKLNFDLQIFNKFLNKHFKKLTLYLPIIVILIFTKLDFGDLHPTSLHYTE